MVICCSSCLRRRRIRPAAVWDRAGRVAPCNCRPAAPRRGRSRRAPGPAANHCGSSAQLRCEISLQIKHGKGGLRACGANYLRTRDKKRLDVLAACHLRMRRHKAVARFALPHQLARQRERRPSALSATHQSADPRRRDERPPSSPIQWPVFAKARSTPAICDSSIPPHHRRPPTTPIPEWYRALRGVGGQSWALKKGRSR